MKFSGDFLGDRNVDPVNDWRQGVQRVNIAGYEWVDGCGNSLPAEKSSLLMARQGQRSLESQFREYRLDNDRTARQIYKEFISLDLDSLADLSIRHRILEFVTRYGFLSEDVVGDTVVLQDGTSRKVEQPEEWVTLFRKIKFLREVVDLLRTDTNASRDELRDRIKLGEDELAFRIEEPDFGWSTGLDIGPVFRRYGPGSIPSRPFNIWAVIADLLAAHTSYELSTCTALRTTLEPGSAMYPRPINLRGLLFLEFVKRCLKTRSVPTIRICRRPDCGQTIRSAHGLRIYCSERCNDLEKKRRKRAANRKSV